jgi:hypothetical protein
VGRLVVRRTSCSRCNEEVGPGAAWCPHCGRDLTEHSPVETSHYVRPERERRFVAVGRALRTGTLGAVVFSGLDLVLFSAAPRAGLLVWTFTMVGVLFALTEFIVPAGPAVHGPQSELSPFSGRHSARRDAWALPSPIQALVVAAPLVCAIAGVALLEGLVYA